MPFVSETYSDLRDSGPVVDIFVAIPRRLSQKLIEGRHEPPAPVRVAAMIDTGADITVVEPGIMETLGIKATGVFRVSSVANSQPKLCPKYHARILFQRQVEVESTDIIAGSLPQGKRIQCLIGRDILRHYIFTYDGPANHISLKLPDSS